MNQMIASDGNVHIWVIPGNGIADYRSPTAAEINAGLNITDALAWDGSTFPSATDSEDIEDRSMLDRGNAVSRGASQFEATLNLFYPRDNKDTVSDYGKAYQMFRVPGIPVYVVTRVLQGTEGELTPAAAGQWVSVYRFMTDGWTDDIEGDDSYKYAIGMLTQGEVAVYTQVKNATPVTITPAGTASVKIGESTALRATLGGKRATQGVRWLSSDNSKATVSPNGVVTGVAVGTAAITAEHPAATGASTATSVTVTAA